MRLSVGRSRSASSSVEPAPSIDARAAASAASRDQVVASEPGAVRTGRCRAAVRSRAGQPFDREHRPRRCCVEAADKRDPVRDSPRPETWALACQAEQWRARQRLDGQHRATRLARSQTPRRGQATTGSSAQPGSSGATESHPSIATRRAGSSALAASRSCVCLDLRALRGRAFAPGWRPPPGTATWPGPGPFESPVFLHCALRIGCEDCGRVCLDHRRPHLAERLFEARGRRRTRTYQIVPTSRGTAASATGSIVASWSRSTITSVSTMAPGGSLDRRSASGPCRMGPARRRPGRSGLAQAPAPIDPDDALDGDRRPAL